MRHLHYFVAVSLDGFIASPSGAFDAFPLQGDHIEAQLLELPETLPSPLRSALGISSPNQTFDTVLMGWSTFAIGGLPSPYAHLRQYVFSRRHVRGDVGNDVTLVATSPVELVRRLKAEDSPHDIWLCGGGSLAAALMSEIDRMTLKVNPVLMGAGIRLFESSAYAPQNLVLQSTRRFASGVLWNSYE